MRPDRDEYLDDDDGRRFSPRRILASGWFRALIVLGALALVLIVAVPYVLRWLDGSPPAPRQQARPAAPPVAAPAPPAPPAPVIAAPPSPPLPAKAETPRAAPAAEKGKRTTAPAEDPRRVRSAKALEPAAAPAASRQAPRPAPAGAGPYWVQVGAFQSASNARRLSEGLRAQGLPVQVAQVSRGATGTTRHEVVVTGASVETVSAALRGSGTAQQSGGLVAVRPALELRDAVALSRRLAGEGLAVRIRRVAAGPTATYHVVRVGGYPNRAAANAAREDVQARGLTAFVTQGPPR